MGGSVLWFCSLVLQACTVWSQNWENDIWYDFETLSVGEDIDIEAFGDLHISTWEQDPCTWQRYPIALPRRFYKENVYIVPESPGRNAMALRTIGTKIVDDQTRVQCAEIVSEYSDVVFGTFAWIAKPPNIPGTKLGYEYYHDDFNQITIEIIIQDILAEGTPEGGYPIDLVILPDYFSTVYVPFDPTEGFHEYRFVWESGKVTFLFDGGSAVVVTSVDTYIPEEPGFILMNHWSNGVKHFVGDPPAEDSIALIRSAHYQFNTTQESRKRNIKY